MYIPRLRKIDAVLKDMKQADPGTIVSRFFLTKLLREGKITSLKYGDAWVVNLDELYGYLNGEVFRDKPYIPPSKRNMQKSGDIWRTFKSEDPNTIIRKLNLRLFIKEQGGRYFVSSLGHWLIDSDELMYRLNPRGVAYRAKAPRLRWHDDTVCGFKKEHPYIPATMNIVENALKSDNVFKIKNGHRWIINYDQLEMEVYRQIGRI